MLDVTLAIGRTDECAYDLRKTLFQPLESLSKKLRGEYGGEMENLWIQLELSPSREHIRKTFAFRYQRVVSPPQELRNMNAPKFHNVGHYSVRPNYTELAEVPMKQAIGYIFQLLYRSTDVLVEKQKRLPGFHPLMFRQVFQVACAEMGYEVHD